MQKFNVKQGEMQEINKDIIRVHESRRTTENGGKIKNGLVCKIFVKETGKSTYAILRGNFGDPCCIIIDEALREKLGVKDGQEYSFVFKKARRYWGWCCWAWNASDPSYQISIRVAIVLGIISIILALIPLFK